MVVAAVHTEGPYALRNNEFFGDLAAWKLAHSADNSRQLERLNRNLREVRRRELTPRQQELLHLHYDQGLSMTEIARQQGISRSAVSRTISRGRDKLRKYLQYSF